MNTPQSSNPFAVAAIQSGAAVQAAQGEITQHLQAGFVMAAKRPRDQHAAFQRIIEACKRKGLAEESSYIYARGGTQITGASIRLLEAIFTCWGNVQSGVIELDQSNGESQMMAYAIDLETNCYDSKIFTVRHERYSKSDGVTKLNDPTDIYLHVANFAARRKRTCMEAIVPRDIIDAAMEQCDLTLKTGHTEPIADRVRKVVAAFAEFGVSTEMLERRLQHKLAAIIEQEIVSLRKIYTSMKDGMSKREDWFDVTEGPKQAKVPTATTPADEKAEAAAGLAPATPPAAAQPPAEDKMAKARAAKAAKTAAPAEPAKAQETQAPPQQASAPAPATPTAAMPSMASVPQATAAPAPTSAPGELFAPQGQEVPAENPENELLKVVYGMLQEHNVKEDEVLDVLKYRKICPDNIEQLVQLPDALLTELTETENFNIISSQVRINRKRKK